MTVFSRLWEDEAGFVVSSELVLIATIAVIGVITGLTTLRDHVVQELADTANAFSTVNQSYSFSAITGHSSSTAGSIFNDRLDFCDNADNNPNGTAPLCLNLVQAATPENN